MAPSKQKSNEPMKQKSLMGWLNKPPTEKKEKAQPTPKPAAAPTSTQTGASKPDNPTTPESKGSNTLEERGSSGVRSEKSGSSVNLREMQTPPTSDPIDVDMLSDAEEEHVAAKPVSTEHVLYNVSQIYIDA